MNENEASKNVRQPKPLTGSSMFLAMFLHYLLVVASLALGMLLFEVYRRTDLQQTFPFLGRRNTIFLFLPLSDLAAIYLFIGLVDSRERGRKDSGLYWPQSKRTWFEAPAILAAGIAAEWALRDCLLALGRPSGFSSEFLSSAARLGGENMMGPISAQPGSYHLLILLHAVVALIARELCFRGIGLAGFLNTGSAARAVFCTSIFSVLPMAWLRTATLEAGTTGRAICGSATAWNSVFLFLYAALPLLIPAVVLATIRLRTGSLYCVIVAGIVRMLLFSHSEPLLRLLSSF